MENALHVENAKRFLCFYCNPSEGLKPSKGWGCYNKKVRHGGGLF